LTGFGRVWAELGLLRVEGVLNLDELSARFMLLLVRIGDPTRIRGMLISLPELEILSQW
jgi:hypothetical protein